MYLDTISYLDMYFFSKMTLSSIDQHKDWLSPYLQANLGQNWHAVLTGDVDVFRAAFDKLLRERAETSASIQDRDALMARVVTWRSVMTSLARQASPERRKVLMQAAGYGLGSPRSVKDLKDFLVEVKARISLHNAAFVELGAPPAILAFAETTLAQLEAASDDVAREKAEDNLSRAELISLHQGLIDRFEKFSLACNAAQGQGLLLDDKVLLNKAQDLQQHLQSALAEARVTAHKRSAEGDIPSDLTLKSTPDASPADADAP